MDRIQLADEVFGGFTGVEDWDLRDKLGSIGLVLMALEISPTERQWRDYLLLAGVNIHDPEVEEVCKQASCFYHYSNMICIGEREEDTWLDVDSQYSLMGVTDETLIATVDELRWQAQMMREVFLPA